MRRYSGSDTFSVSIKWRRRRRGERRYYKACLIHLQSSRLILYSLAESLDNDEVFSWEDDDDDPSSPNPARAASGTAAGKVPVSAAQRPLDKPSASSSPVLVSPRQSSEEGYDLISSGNVSVSAEVRDTAKASTGDEQDSDWE